MDFITIKDNVESYILDLPVVTQALVGTYVNKALRDATKRPHNFRHMEADTGSVVTVEGVRKLSDVPVLWKSRRGFPVLVRDDFTRREIEWMTSASEDTRRFPREELVTSRGEPEFVRVAGDEPGIFKLFPAPDGLSDYPDGDYRINIPYWTHLDLLVEDGDTNWWTDTYEWYIIFQAAHEGMKLNRDFENAAIFRDSAEKEYQKARTADIRAKLPERMHLHMSRDVFGISKGRRRL